jgi:hypothetical protein
MSDTNNLSPEQLAEQATLKKQPKTLKVSPNISDKTPEPPQNPTPQPTDNNDRSDKDNSGQASATDNQGNTNVSRGIIGLVTNPDPGYITEGTIADKVNPATRFQKSGKTNPVTEEDLKKRMENERAKAGMDSGIQEQRVIKIRTEMQGFKYTPPEEYKNVPGLEATPDFTQEKEPNPDAEQNETEVQV